MVKRNVINEDIVYYEYIIGNGRLRVWKFFGVRFLI